MLSHHLDTQDDRLVVEEHVERLRAAAAPRPARASSLRRSLGHALVALGLRVAGERTPVRRVAAS
jgi:hypothetical protein